MVAVYKNPHFIRDHCRGRAVRKVTYDDTTAHVECVEWTPSGDYIYSITYDYPRDELPEAVVAKRYEKVQQGE